MGVGVAGVVNYCNTSSGTASDVVAYGGVGGPYEYCSFFSVLNWFAAGEQGAWYDPSDINVNWRRNLLTWSQAIGGTNWIIFGSVGGVCNQNDSIAPDGTLTASKFITPSGSAVSTYIGQNITTVAGNFTGSIYLKYAGYQYVQVFCRTILDYVNIDLLSGSVTASSIGTPDITSVGNGWYRVALTSTLGAALNNNSISPIQTGTSGRATTFISDGTSGIYIWGAQLEQSSSPSTYQKITDGIQDYYTVQPQPVLFQDSAGTTPITAVEQPVGLMLDKSKGLALGAELVTNGTFDTNITGWNNISLAGGVITWDASGYIDLIYTTGTASADTSITTVVGKTYKISLNKLATASVVNIGATRFGSGLFNQAEGAIDLVVYFTATTTTSYITIARVTAGTAKLDNISVKQIAGNHAFQSDLTLAKRPILSARVNLLTKTEAIATSPWAIRSTGTIVATDNYAIAPNGTMTATLLNKTSTTDAQWQQSFTGVVGTIYTGSIFIQKTLTNNVVEIAARSAYNITSGDVYGDIDTKTGLTYVRFGLGTISAQSVGGYWAVTLITTTSAGATVDSALMIRPTIGTVLGSYDATATGSCVVWGADLRPTNAGALLPPYQRVNTASDYDTVGFPLYLKANGTSSAMSTNSIDFTSTDKMTVVTGVALKGTLEGLLLELGGGAGNPGAFSYEFNAISAGDHASQLVGTAYKYTTGGSYPVKVNTDLFDRSGASVNLQIIQRNNGVVASSTVSGTTLATGNFANLPLYLFARAGTSLFLNGQFYGAIIRGAQSDTASVTQTENYMATKTGITF